MSNKAVLAESFQVVWGAGDLDALPRFWTEDCVNHAMPSADNRGLAPLRAYHEHMLAAFAGFDAPNLDVVQQVEEADRLVTHLVFTAIHARPFMGIEAAGRSVSLATIRIDRFREGRIAEHWSVADMAGLTQQMRG